ncbi:MAG: V-type proton ATPase subunit E [Candidatus Methanomethylicia archaeon]|nr:V-type proton ATPase subunit E [Candidatus Methanomethylicia archaeon]MCX8169118.1 V-type proton ATPase subunit E [Candidatus Methanomethylicia archaeon]MDW7988850.1 V-type ATP synthase subunit E family protein [Nitrososphaerota archaeon]
MKEIKDELKIIGNLRTLLDSISLRADDMAKKIIEEAKKEGEKIIEAAKKQAEEILNNEIKKFMQLLEVEKKQKINEINSKTAEEILKEREKIFNEVMQLLEYRLIKLRNTKEYRTLIKRLIVESCINLGGGDILVKMDSKDNNLQINLKEIIEEVKMRTNNETKINMLFVDNITRLGGAIVSSIDETITCDNTLEAIIERRKKDIRKVLYEKLARSGDLYG